MAKSTASNVITSLRVQIFAIANYININNYFYRLYIYKYEIEYILCKDFKKKI